MSELYFVGFYRPMKWSKGSHSRQRVWYGQKQGRIKDLGISEEILVFGNVDISDILGESCYKLWFIGQIQIAT